MEKTSVGERLGADGNWGQLPNDVAHAASIGDTKSVILWVTSGYPVDARDFRGFTLAGNAANSGQEITFRRLVEFGERELCPRG